MRYTDYFRNTRMPEDLHGFAEKAIEIAGKAGERKRKYGKEIEEMLARSRMAELERQETGLGERLKTKEAGFGRRLGREQEFARPARAAEIGRLGAATEELGARAEETRYGTGFEKGIRESLEDIIRSKGRFGEARTGEAELSLREGLREERLRDEAEIRAETEAARPEVPKPEVTAKPRRKMRPGLKKFLWEGWPEIGAPGLGAPVKGYLDIADLLGRGIKGGYEYAFPRSR